MNHPRPSTTLRARLAGVLASALWLAASAAHGGLVVVQNDSVTDFGSAVIQAGFVAGERGAAWLTPTCDGELVAVRLLWLDLFGGGSQTLGDSITVSDAGAFPVPGAIRTQLVAPLMTEGFFNEFVIDPPIALASDETVVVDFKFFTDPPATGPSLVTDVDGCQAARNGIFAIPPSQWFNACSLGVSGDFAIRAVLNCDLEIFADGFESGDTSAWTTTQTAGGTLAAAGYPVLRVEVEPPAFWRRPDPE
jgi:hypothetical protein